MNHRRKFWVIVGLGALVWGNAILPVSASPRPFTFSYTTYPMAKGDFEYEQWATWQHHTEEDAGFDRLALRHEFEFGLADNFTLGLYLPNWSYEDSAERAGSRFDSVGAEGILYLLNPVTDPFGLGLYGEVNVGEEEVEFEYKLLLQKDIDNWSFVYNLVLETEIEGAFEEGENELEGVLGHTFGVNYALKPGLKIGAELVVESEYEDWSDYEGTTVYAGPALNYMGGKVGGSNVTWWVTVTPMFQLSNHEDEPDFQVRTIIGFEF
jgi:hypothetical protein